MFPAALSPAAALHVAATNEEAQKGFEESASRGIEDVAHTAARRRLERHLYRIEEARRREGAVGKERLEARVAVALREKRREAYGSLDTTRAYMDETEGQAGTARQEWEGPPNASDLALGTHPKGPQRTASLSGETTAASPGGCTAY